MTTNFPSSVDNFTNPTSSSTMASPSHSAQHADVNDAVEAIETALLDGAPLHVDDANERVGIGTTSPAYKLDVAGDIHISNSTPYLIFTDTDTNAESRISASSGVGSLIIDADYNDEQAGTNIIFKSDGSERMRIDDSGRVGIGTTSPGAPLHVSSTAGEGVRIQKSNNDQEGSYISYYDDNARLGYVGYAGNDDLYLENEASAGKTFLSTAGSVRMAIDSSGNVGIGDTTPSYKLDVNGTGRFTDELHVGTSSVYNGELNVKRGTGTNSYLTGNGNFAASIYHATNSGTSHGLFVANQWQNDTSRLLVMGNIDAASNGFYQKWYATGMGRSYNYYGTWGTISDQTLKTDIVDANAQLQDILDLRFVNYKFIQDIETHGEEAPRLFGLIAQEVEAVSPGLVIENDGIKTVNTSVLSMKAVKAMQEMHALIESQQTIISDLTARIEALENPPQE